MKVLFNNGKIIEIDKKIAQRISEKITNGAKQWQIFSKDGTDNLVINLVEVSCIVDESVYPIS